MRIRQMVLIENYNRSRWHVLMLCFSLALLTNGAATTAKAQSENLLHEKLDFLKAKLESNLSHSLGVEQGLNVGEIKFEAISFETSKITWKISTEFGNSTELP